MSGWTPEDFAAFHEPRQVQLETVTIRGKAITIAVGQFDPLVGYQAQRRNPLLDVVLNVDPPDRADAEEQAPQQPEHAADHLRFVDRLFTLGIVEPKYYPMSQLPQDGSLPRDGLCLRSFDMLEQAHLVNAILGDASALEYFRSRAVPATAPARASDDVPSAAQQSADSHSVASASPVAGRSDSVPRPARRRASVETSGGASPAESAEPAA